MAFIGNYVDPNASPAVDFAPLPAGEYQAIIIDSDLKPTRGNDGEYLELTYKITEGPLAGRTVWARLNLVNKNQQTVAIANQHLAACREACGIAAITESTQLHNIPHVIRVDFIPAGTRQRNGTVTTRDSNEVKAWKRLEGGAPATQGAAAPSPFQRPAAPAAQAAPAAPTWANKPAAA